MTRRAPRPVVFDASALVALFAAHPDLLLLVRMAEWGRITACLPTACIAHAQETVQSPTGWEFLFAAVNVRTVPLGETAAVEIGLWPGLLAVRHAVHEARSLDAEVVTCSPGDYAGLDVPLLAL